MGIWEWTHLWLNGWGIYDMDAKSAGLQGSTLFGHHVTTGFGPLNSRPVDYYREGWTTPHLRLVLFEEPSSQLVFTVL